MMKTDKSMINPFFISLFRLPKFVVTKILKHNQTYQPMKEKDAPTFSIL